MKYIIKNIKSNVYYNKTISKNTFHFVAEINEAHIFKSKKEASKVYSIFKDLREFENFEIIKR